jgi:type IV pilus assembly protein PilP
MGNITAKTVANKLLTQVLLSGFIVSLSVSVTGCASNDNSDLHNRIDQIKARPAAKIPPLPAFKPYETFKYSRVDATDPFEMIAPDRVETAVESVDSPLAGRNLETLEQYPLDTLRYVGQLVKDGREWAIVTSPDQIVHRVNVGNYLGQNYGKIITIKEDKIEIVETIPDNLGGWISRDAALSLME